MAEKTPGRVSFEARRGSLWRRLGSPADNPLPGSDQWDQLNENQRADEEAGAQAVLGTIAELLPEPCREPGIADGNDLCPCRSGEVWPCSLTRAAWLAAGLDPAAEMRKVLDAAKRQMAAEQAEWEALHEEDPEAARRKALRDLGWTR